MKKLTIIIQARMGSTRLPNKVLADVEGKPMLWHIVNRLTLSKFSPQIIIATTCAISDKKIIELAKSLNLQYFAGSIDDVLDRYYQTALRYNVEIVARITGDCPLIDPTVFDKLVREFLDGNYDYISNTNPPTYPDGLDVEIFTFEALKKAWKEAKLSSDREHVTAYIYKNPNLFKLGNVSNNIDLSHLRWTVDEKEDLQFVREIYKHLYSKNQNFTTDDILEILNANPELLEINTRFKRNEGYLKSLQNDKTIK